MQVRNQLNQKMFGIRLDSCKKGHDINTIYLGTVVEHEAIDVVHLRRERPK